MKKGFTAFWKKFTAWAKTKKGKTYLVLSGIAFVVLAAYFVNMFITAAGVRTTEEIASKVTVTSADQTYLVSHSGLNPIAWEPTEEEAKAGFDKVEPLASTAFLNMVADEARTVGSVSVNSTNNVVAFMGRDSKDTPVVYASALLPVQVDEVLKAFAARNISVDVVGANAEAIPPALSKSIAERSAEVTGGAVAYPASSTPTTGARGVKTTATSVVTIPVGLTSPYVIEANALARGFGSSTTGTAAAANSEGSILWTFLWLIVAAFFIMWMLRLVNRSESKSSSKGGSAGSLLKSGKKDSDADASNIPNTRFTDVAGADEAIEEMQELVDFLKFPEKFSRVGAVAPRGALLVGPPGTGKTLLARAVAGEAGVPFYSVAGSDFVEMYVGVGAKRVRELFAKARKHEEGAIIFIDEIDAVGRARGSAANTSSNSEGENTLNALLVEMDGFAKSNVIVLGATNRDDILDKALLRPGRLDRRVQVPLPDRAGRERILEVHTAKRPLEEGISLNLIARRTPGMSGAELAQLVNEASMVAAREGRDIITAEDFDAAVATVAMGKARLSAVVTEHDRLVTAWHEAGHTVAAMVLPDADEPVSVSIIPRGPAGGVTWMAQGDDLFLTRKRAFARLVVALGGRAAEEILLDGEFTSGPHGDLTAATQTAMAMVTQYGMTDTGLMIRSEGLLSTGSRITDDTIEAVEALLAEALNMARVTLAAHRDLLQAVVDGLLENDNLSHKDLLDIQEGVETFAPELPLPPTDYRREPRSKERVPVLKPVVADLVAAAIPVAPHIEQVRFGAPDRRRTLRLGPIHVSLPGRKKGKGRAV